MIDLLIIASDIVLLIGLLFVDCQYHRLNKKYEELAEENHTKIFENRVLRAKIDGLNEMNDNVIEKYEKVCEKLNMIEKQVSKLPADYQKLIRSGE